MFVTARSHLHAQNLPTILQTPPNLGVNMQKHGKMVTIPLLDGTG